MAYPLHLDISFRKILFSHRAVISFPRPNVYFPSPIFSTHWHWSQSTAIMIILSSQSKQTEGTPISRHTNLCRQVLFGEGSLIPMTAVFSNSAYKTGMLLPGKTTLWYSWASLVAQTVKNQLAVWGTWVLFLGQEDLLEKGMVTHPSILAWRIPWTEESMGPQRV